MKRKHMDEKEDKALIKKMLKTHDKKEMREDKHEDKKEHKKMGAKEAKLPKADPMRTPKGAKRGLTVIIGIGKPKGKK